MKIVVTGSSGLVGSGLVPFLRAQEVHEVRRLVRAPKPNEDRTFHWDPERGEIDREALEGSDIVIHLSGENVASGYWTAEKKARIRDSRVLSTEFLVETFAKLQSPPKTFLCASATGFYGNRGHEELTEASPAGTGFLSSVCQEWESKASAAEELGMRVAMLRFGIVLSRSGGALKTMLQPFRFGLGGPIGNGEQWMSWIAIDDVYEAIWHVINNPTLKGPVNFVAPDAVTNRTFSRRLGKALHRPSWLPFPAFMARFLLGEMADEMLLLSEKVRPHALIQAGYLFRYPTLEQAFHHLVGK